jgi:hypothetical protein
VDRLCEAVVRVAFAFHQALLDSIVACQVHHAFASKLGLSGDERLEVLLKKIRHGHRELHL